MSFHATFNRARSFVIRHRVSIQDITLVILATLVVAYLAYDIDVFETGYDPIRNTIEVDELPLIGAVLSLGMLFFSWRRAREQ